MELQDIAKKLEQIVREAEEHAAQENGKAWEEKYEWLKSEIQREIDLLGDKRLGVKMEDRKTTLLKATLALLKKCGEGSYVKHALEETVFYDGVDCDGACLANDIAAELGEEEPF